MQVIRLFPPIHAWIAIEVMSAYPYQLLLPRDVPRSLPSVAPHTSPSHPSYITAAVTVLILFSSNAAVAQGGVALIPKNLCQLRSYQRSFTERPTEGSGSRERIAEENITKCENPLGGQS